MIECTITKDIDSLLNEGVDTAYAGKSAQVLYLSKNKKVVEVKMIDDDHKSFYISRSLVNIVHETNFHSGQRKDGQQMEYPGVDCG